MYIDLHKLPVKFKGSVVFQMSLFILFYFLFPMIFPQFKYIPVHHFQMDEASKPMEANKAYELDHL